jgi:hypothetical protein
MEIAFPVRDYKKNMLIIISLGLLLLITTLFSLTVGAVGIPLGEATVILLKNAVTPSSLMRGKNLRAGLAGLPSLSP